MTEQSSAWREPVPLENRVSTLERHLSKVIAIVDETAKLRAVLTEVENLLKIPELSQWDYMKEGGFQEDKDRLLAKISKILQQKHGE